MGRNNRQRRAAKQKSRTQRGPTPPRSRGAAGPAAEFDELFGDPGLFDGYEQPRPAPPTVTERAQRLLEEWIDAAWRQGDNQVLRIWGGHQLQAVDDDVLLRADVLLGERLLADIARLWAHGWQLRDLLHVTQRVDKRAAVLAADLAVEQLRLSKRLDLAPEGWREQLDDGQRRAREAGIPPLAGDVWAPLDRLLTSGVALTDAFVSSLRLLVRIGQLRPITLTLPPPASWTSTKTSAGSRSTTTGVGQAAGSDARRDKVLTKIRALLAKAESTEHAAEAETFTAKAQDLMTRHAIDEALLHAGAEESVDVRSRRVLIDHPYPLEKVRLLNAVGQANRVRVIWIEELAIATVVGTPVDIDQVEMLFVSLLIQATRAMTEAGAHRAGSFDRSPTFRRSFLTSYAVRIGERLEEADAEAAASYGSALVPVLKRQQEAVDEEFQRLFPNTYDSSRTRYYDQRGWTAGREAADRATFVAGRIAG